MAQEEAIPRTQSWQGGWPHVKDLYQPPQLLSWAAADLAMTQWAAQGRVGRAGRTGWWRGNCCHSPALRGGTL